MRRTSLNSATDLVELARRQLADYDAHQPGLFFRDAPYRLTIAQAYEVQRQVAALRATRGEAVAGYKIGCTSEAVQRQLGIERPVFGHLFATGLYRSGVALDVGEFCRLEVEGEFAVRIGADLSIVSAFPVIELHNNVFRGAARTPQELIANNAIHAGVVLPATGIASPDAAELVRGAISVFCNGELLGTASGAAIPGGPLESVVRVAEHLASFGAALEPGQIVLTGSPLPLYPVRPGDHVVVRGPQSIEVELSVLV
jgi:2-keto-4-pentenoate hydratase